MSVLNLSLLGALEEWALLSCIRQLLVFLRGDSTAAECFPSLSSQSLLAPSNRHHSCIWPARYHFPRRT